MKHPFAYALIILATICTAARGTEPNETFAMATVLSPGVVTVADGLTPNTPAFPDTLLGIRDGFGRIYFVDDDSSPLGDGHASGVGGVSTNSGSIDFSITAFPDNNFIGDHGESGQYKVFVDAFDFVGDSAGSFSELRTLTPGVVHNFSFTDFDWIGGDYDVYIDNALALTSDVDFFTFSGLTPGTQFAARTADPTASNVNTLLGWFDSGGTFLDSDDDGGGGLLSRIDGIVPAAGTLTFAVSGLDDVNFTGNHSEDGAYELRLQIGVPGDYNKNNVVDAADYVVWRENVGAATLNNRDPNGMGAVGQADYNFWRNHFGQSVVPGSSTNVAVPEPACVILAWCALVGVALRRRCCR